MKKGKSKRMNVYFRQTSKAFKVARQTQIFSHINRNLPYKLYKYSKKQIGKRAIKFKSFMNKGQNIFVLKSRKELKYVIKNKKSKK